MIHTPHILAELHVAQPWWALAAVAAVVPIWLARRARATGTPSHWASVAARSLAVALLAVALTGPVWTASTDRVKPVLVLQDASVSLADQADPLAIPTDVPTLEYVFAADLARTSAGRTVDRSQTRIAPALRLAASRREQVAGVIIRTDGQFTDDDWPQAARQLGRTGLPVWIVPAGPPAGDVRIVDISADRNADGAASLAITLRATDARRAELTVRRAWDPPELLQRGQVTLAAGQPVTVRLADAQPGSGPARYSAQLAGPDPLPGNNAASVLLPAQRFTVAVIGDDDLPRRIGSRLGQADLRTLEPASVTPERLSQASAILLVDPTGRSLDEPARAALAGAVRRGAGLVHVGAGPYGSPADLDDPLNGIAALQADPHRRKPLAVVVLLDASGSMGEQATGRTGLRKFDLARQAVTDLRRHLTDADSLAVVCFAAAARIVYDSGSASPDYEKLAQSLRQVSPAGATDLAPALRTLARRGAAQADRDGLVVVVSDLQTQPFDVASASRALSEGRWQLGVVALAGPDESTEGTELAELARRLDAPLLRRESLADLAELLAGFVRAGRGEPVAEGPFAWTGRDELFGVSRPQLPRLGEVIVTSARPDADTLADASGHPVLARRSAGMGRVVNLAIDTSAPANSEFAASDSAIDLLAGALRWVRGPGGDGRFSADLVGGAGTVQLRVQARDDGEPMDRVALTARLIPAEPTDETVEATLPQTAPGEYRAELPAPDGPARVEVLREGAVVWQGMLAELPPRELRYLGVNEENLRTLAEHTKGRRLRAGQLPAVADQLSAHRQTVRLGPWLALLAVAVVLVQWAWTGRPGRSVSGQADPG